jgi:hypothetical protein
MEKKRVAYVGGAISAKSYFAQMANGQAAMQRHHEEMLAAGYQWDGMDCYTWTGEGAPPVVELPRHLFMDLGVGVSVTGRHASPPEMQNILRVDPETRSSEHQFFSGVRQLAYEGLRSRMALGFVKGTFTEPSGPARPKRLNFRSRFMRVRHRDSGKTAIAQRGPRGTVLVQFNDIEHPHGHGWHLYPRHHWERRR